MFSSSTSGLKQARLLVAICAAFIVAAAYRLMTPGNPDADQLALVRTNVESMFSTQNAAVRQMYARKCIELAKPLMERKGVLNTTATLYVLGASKVVGYDADHISIPPFDDVKQVPTEDLLPIAGLLYKTKRFAPADQLISLLLSREPDRNREAVLRLAYTIRLDLGRDKEALQHADELIALQPADPESYRAKATVYRNHGRWDHYVEVAAKVVKLTHEEDSVSHIGLIDGLLHLGRTADARRELNKVEKRRPDIVSLVPTMHARLLLQEGRNDEAIPILEQHISVDPTDSEALVVLGTLQVGDAAYATAIKTLTNAIAVSPAEEKAYYQLGQAYARIGNTDAAKVALEKHRSLLDEKILLFELEQQAALEPLNVEIKRTLANAYRKIGIPELADFWTRSAAAVE